MLGLYSPLTDRAEWRATQHVDLAHVHATHDNHADAPRRTAVVTRHAPKPSSSLELEPRAGAIPETRTCGGLPQFGRRAYLNACPARAGQHARTSTSRGRRLFSRTHARWPGQHTRIPLTDRLDGLTRVPHRPSSPLRDRPEVGQHSRKGIAPHRAHRPAR